MIDYECSDLKLIGTLGLHFIPQKLERRQKAIEGAPLSERDKGKAMEVFHSPSDLDFMSSEERDMESENTSGPQPRKVKKLQWQRTKLRNIKSVLDRHHDSMRTPKKRRTTAPIRVSNDFSNRDRPRRSPKWAVRQPTESEFPLWTLNHNTVHQRRWSLNLTFYCTTFMYSVIANDAIRLLDRRQWTAV